MLLQNDAVFFFDVRDIFYCDCYQAAVLKTVRTRIGSGDWERIRKICRDHDKWSKETPEREESVAL